MPNITVLDQNTINKIAAGEVIERPASVVKELLENAIDARATAVTVEIKDGGIAFIRVTDNGCGIAKEELPLAFLRHSTSKIKSVEDLMTISSLGFRGEALSSIAAVSQVEVITQTAGSLTGARYQIEGGQEKSLEEVGAPEGTTFISRNLFYNTPARRKFLKTPQTEGAHVAELVEKMALSRPDISIRLIQNNQNKLHTSGNSNLKDVIYTVFGREITANLIPLETGAPPVCISGFIGKPVIARSNRNYENYYINGRYIKSGLIAKAIEEAYKPFMMQHKYPFTLLHFTIDPGFLDVNVHPTKMELRFKDQELIYKTVFHAISAALSHKELIPEVELGEKQAEKNIPQLKPVRIREPEPFEVNRAAERVAQPAAPYGAPEQKNAAGSGAGTGERNGITAIDKSGWFGGRAASARNVPADGVLLPAAPVPSKVPVSGTDKAAKASDAAAGIPKAADKIPLPADAAPETPPAAGTPAPEQMTMFEEKLLTPKARASHRLIGQLFDTYWLIEYQDQLYIIDQHAAHEKVLYEKTMATLKSREYTSQLLNPPIILSLSRSEEVLLLRYIDHFRAIGFELEHFGGREYAVRGVPANLFSLAKKELLMEMIDDLSDEQFTDRNPDIIYERIASMSCKAAVKGNHRLSEAEANHLIDQLLDLENPYACPHGRPTIISMSKRELEKKFKRIV